MPLIALRVSLALWKRRYRARLKLRHAARQELLEATAASTSERQRLTDRKILREQQTDQARKRIVLREQQIDAKLSQRVREPLCRVRLDVACQSSRNGTKPRLIVLHDTEGANLPGIADLEGLGAYFDRITTQASSHVATDAEGNSARYVPDNRKAWHCASYNSVSLGVEQIGYASQKTWPAPQLEATSRWCAYWAKEYGIPLVHSTGSGVCRHSDLGTAGGGHRDPGAAYPFDDVLARARVLLKNGW
jgi:N-acetyl-anhydromuramyl-L-alanine amidase AmpD